MKNKKVLFITAPLNIQIAALRPNMGLGYLAQFLEEHSVDCDVLDMLLGYKINDLKTKIKNYAPDILGISLCSNKYKAAYQMLEQIKAAFPTLSIIAGGPHVSCFKELVLKDCQAIDCAIVLEGEKAFLQLCSETRHEQIKNLIYRKDGQIISNPTDDLTQDLDSLPFPKYKKFELHKYSPEKPILSSRGCPHNCTYCAVKTITGKTVRLRSPHKVVDEIEYWYKKGFKQFSFQDDHFTLHKDHVFAICDEIQNRGMNKLFLACAGARADSLDREILDRMKLAGFRSIAIGIEAGNDKMLKILKKGETLAQMDKAVAAACQSGLDVYLHFLFPLPNETVKDIEDSIAFAKKHPVMYVEWVNVVPYPGTELYETLKKDNLLLSPPEEYLNYETTSIFGVNSLFYPLFKTPGISLKERRKLAKRIKRERRRIHQKTFTRWLATKKIAWGFRHIIAFALSFETISTTLKNSQLRKTADKIRAKLTERKT